MLTSAERTQIVTMRSLGMKWSDVVNEMQRIFGVTVSVRGCAKIMKKWKESETVVDLPRSGRPKLFDERESRQVRRLALAHRDLTYRQVAAEHATSGTRASKWTVMRTLRRFGLRRRVAVRRPRLTRRMMLTRLKWARDRSKWSLYRWKQVIFCDEKIFRFDSNKLRCYVTRFDHEKYSRSCIRTTVKSGIEVHVWGIISWNGPGPIKVVNGTLNAVRYQAEILDDIDLIGARLANTGQSFVFMHDMAPAHRAATTQRFLNGKNVRVLPWCGNSPDLNPIENLWAIVQRRVNRAQVRNRDELLNAVRTSFAEISIEYLHALYRSLPRRLLAVIRARGGNTRY
jgi:transposase